MASRSDAELEERFDPPATPLQSGKQFMPRYLAAVDRGGIAIPRSVAVDPTGRFVYVTNLISNNISAYTIDGTGAALYHWLAIFYGIAP